MTQPAAEDRYVLHTAGAVIDQVQRCSTCQAVLADERPGGERRTASALRFTRGCQVLVCVGPDYAVIGPVPLDKPPPRSTRTCTAPVPSGSKDTP